MLETNQYSKLEGDAFPEENAGLNNNNNNNNNNDNNNNKLFVKHLSR